MSPAAAEFSIPVPGVGTVIVRVILETPAAPPATEDPHETRRPDAAAPSLPHDGRERGEWPPTPPAAPAALAA